MYLFKKVQKLERSMNILMVRSDTASDATGSHSVKELTS